MPNESAFLAWIAALLRQVARRLSRLDFDVFFLGTAIVSIFIEAQPSQYIRIELNPHSIAIAQRDRAVPKISKSCLAPDYTIKLHSLSQSKYSKLPNPLPDRKFDWIELGDKDAIFSYCIKMVATSKQYSSLASTTLYR